MQSQSAGEPEGLVFDIQRFSVHDGPGIRTTIFLKGCPLRCTWCQNPESQKSVPEMLVFVDRCVHASDSRVACTADCTVPCHSGAIRVSPGHAPEIDHENCGACGDCALVCGYGALEVVGQVMTASDVLEKAKADLPYYQASGGGITLSGGEPMLQPDFVAAIVDGCARIGIPVGLQTCGAYAPAAMDRILGQLAFIQFDLKVMDSTQHHVLTGADNRSILRHARDLVQRKAPVEFRRLVVPGLNDGEAELDLLAAFLHDIGHPRATLLQHHCMGEVKLPRIGRPMPEGVRPTTAESEAAVHRTRELLQARGIEVCA